MNQKPLSPPAFRPDLIKRPESNLQPPRKPETSPQNNKNNNSEKRKQMVVGEGITFSGEIKACDDLIVEGTVEATVRDGRCLQIAPSGLFQGTIEIDEADIAGRFEGDITVRGRLCLRSTGRIDGKVQYSELEIEAGGHVEGEVHGLKSVKPVAAHTPLKPRSMSMSEAPNPPLPQASVSGAA